MKAPWRKVITSTWGTRGVTLADNNWRSGTGRYWYLTLDCGHKAIRPFRYFRCTGFTTYRLEDALPSPTKVRCSDCVLTAERTGI